MSYQQLTQKYRPLSFHERLDQKLVGAPFDSYGMPRNTRYSPRAMGLYNPAMIGTLTPPTPVGGWIELARTTLGAAASSITVSGLADKRYYQILCDINYTGAGNLITRFEYNADTGMNYADRNSFNDSVDATSINQADSATLTQTLESAGDQAFIVNYLANLAAKEKLNIADIIDTDTGTGAGFVPNRREKVWKWVNTADAFSAVKLNNVGGGNNFSSGDEVVVLGWDPADTHTDNFWEELASVNGDGTSSFDTGTFTARKYLWIQAYVQRNATANNTNFTVGNATLDTGSNYTRRRNVDGGTDDTVIDQSNIPLSTIGTEEFYNIFIINNALNEKLFIIHVVNRGTAGAGNAPNRAEFVAKWINTSNQLNIFGIDSGGVNTLSSTSQIKVWGSD